MERLISELIIKQVDELKNETNKGKNSWTNGLLKDKS
jgi:hypothetical protein